MQMHIHSPNYTQAHINTLRSHYGLFVCGDRSCFISAYPWSFQTELLRDRVLLIQPYDPLKVYNVLRLLQAALWVQPLYKQPFVVLQMQPSKRSNTQPHTQNTNYRTNEHCLAPLDRCPRRSLFKPQPCAALIVYSGPHGPSRCCSCDFATTNMNSLKSHMKRHPQEHQAMQLLEQYRWEANTELVHRTWL